MRQALVTILFISGMNTLAQELDWPVDFEDRRFKEDWALDDWDVRGEESRNWSDWIKTLPLSRNKNIWLGIGGQLRVRYMGTVNENFEGQNSGLFTIRGRLHSDLHLGRHFRLFAEGIYSNTTDDETRQLGIGSPVTQGAVLNLFSEIYFGPDNRIAVWGGRRELQWGHERMVSPGNWLMTRRSWDGGGASVNLSSNLYISGFVTRPVVVVPDGYSTRDEGSLFWGVRLQNTQISYGSNAGYASRSWSTYQSVLIEPYFLSSFRKNVQFEQGQEDDQRQTIGLLVSGPISGGLFDYEFEGMYQTGTFGSSSINAYSITAEFGASPDMSFLKPHFWIGFDYSSGDSDPNDNKLETFDPLYAQVSTWFGEHGNLDRKNLVAYSANMDFSLSESLTGRLSYWNFGRARSNDAVYNTANGIFRGVNGSSNKDMGNSFQAAITYDANYQSQFSFTYNLWAPGQFFAETQTNTLTDQHFFMITGQYTF